jgi:kynureninase
MLTRQACLEMDAADPLRGMRERFALREDLIYLDGNSLGAMPRAVGPRLRQVVEVEWAQDLIAGWNRGWIDLPGRVGAKIARLIGAEADEVICADSVSVDLFKLAGAAVQANAPRRVILTEAGDFHTDRYVLEGVASLIPEVELRLTPPGGWREGLDTDVAVVLLCHGHYRTGAVRDMAEYNAEARAAGALTLWDLSHSAGVLEIDLNGAGADLAVGCGYKYLNGGPGAPAFVFVGSRHQQHLANPISGWMGHARPFAFEGGYEAAPGMGRWLAGTPPILSLSALDAALDAFDGCESSQLQAKARALGALFIRLMDERAAGLGFELASPREASQRGGQVAYAHPQAWPIVQALIAAEVVGDFRSPDVARFGFSPLYIRFVDVWDAVERLVEIMGHDRWRRPEFQRRALVT